jgi:hypothetical protein
LDHPIDRHSLSWPDAQSMAYPNMLERYIFFLSVLLDQPGCLWRKPEQGTNRGTRLTPSLQLKDLAKQDEHRNDGRSLEIDRDRAIMQSE